MTPLYVAAIIVGLSILAATFYATYQVALERGADRARSEETALTQSDLIAYNNALHKILANVEDLIAIMNNVLQPDDNDDWDDWEDPNGVRPAHTWEGMAHT